MSRIPGPFARPSHCCWAPWSLGSGPPGLGGLRSPSGAGLWAAALLADSGSWEGKGGPQASLQAPLCAPHPRPVCAGKPEAWEFGEETLGPPDPSGAAAWPAWVGTACLPSPRVGAEPTAWTQRDLLTSLGVPGCPTAGAVGAALALPLGRQVWTPRLPSVPPGNSTSTFLCRVPDVSPWSPSRCPNRNRPTHHAGRRLGPGGPAHVATERARPGFQPQPLPLRRWQAPWEVGQTQPGKFQKVPEGFSAMAQQVPSTGLAAMLGTRGHWEEDLGG